jgi:hypothetical protein
MSALRALIAWLLGAGTLTAGVASFGLLLSPATVDGPVVPPISPPGWVIVDGVIGEKL